MMQPYLETAIRDAGELLGRLSALSPELKRVGIAFGRCWNERGKVLIAGNGGSAADAMRTGHRRKNRKTRHLSDHFQRRSVVNTYHRYPRFTDVSQMSVVGK